MRGASTTMKSNSSGARRRREEHQQLPVDPREDVTAPGELPLRFIVGRDPAQRRRVHGELQLCDAGGGTERPDGVCVAHPHQIEVRIMIEHRMRRPVILQVQDHFRAVVKVAAVSWLTRRCSFAGRHTPMRSLKTAPGLLDTLDADARECSPAP